VFFSRNSSYQRDYKLLFSYLISPRLYVFLKTHTKNTRNTTLFLKDDLCYYVIVHLKFSTNFYNSQLSDIFAYETTVNTKPLLSNTVVVYNFHNIFFHDRLFLFSTKKDSLKSITDLFPNASWLEREVAELHGLNFNGKKDVRNLMLQYGDTSAPFRKSYPSIGRKEMFYDGLNDLIVQLPVAIQV